MISFIYGLSVSIWWWQNEALHYRELQLKARIELKIEFGLNSLWTTLLLKSTLFFRFQMNPSDSNKATIKLQMGTLSLPLFKRKAADFRFGGEFHELSW